jgi:FixJ family two-component response regulator
MLHLPKLAVISIVDDDKSIRQAMRSLVSSLGFEAQTFGSAEEYLGSPRAGRTSCLISDVQLPNMSGIELHEHLRALGQQTPVIFITGFPDRRVAARARGAGVIGVLTKPFDGRTLIGCIEAALAAAPSNFPRE